MNTYRVHMAHTPAAWIDINATSYTIDERGLIRFRTNTPHGESPAVFPARNVFAIQLIP